MSAGVRVVGHDHVVFLVDDVERSLAWYRGKLGLVSEREAGGGRGGRVPVLADRRVHRD